MYNKKVQLPKNRNGFTLIEILVAMGVMATLAGVVFYLLTTIYQIVSFTKTRLTALHLAQEKMETLRNLAYEEVGTQGGIPAGDIPQDEVVIRNSQAYTIDTSVIYVDDSFDNYAPQDTLPTDYKRIRVEVNWQGTTSSGNNPVVLISDIAPRGLETDSGGGTLSILVFNASGVPVTDANVLITSVGLAEEVNLNQTTDSFGRIYLPGTPSCSNCYNINVSKEGFSTDKTYSTDEVANPAKPYATVIEGELTEISFSIDQTATLTINTYSSRESGFTPISASFTLFSEKIIGTDTLDDPVYKYSQVVSSSAGSLVLEEMEWGSYWISFDTQNYSVSGENPNLPIALDPNTPTSVDLALSPFSANNLLLTFTDTSNNKLATVSATLQKEGFNQEKESGESGDPDFGQVFFANLTPDTYQLVASASGYLDYSRDVIVTNQVKEKVILTNE